MRSHAKALKDRLQPAHHFPRMFLTRWVFWYIAVSHCSMLELRYRRTLSRWIRNGHLKESEKDEKLGWASGSTPTPSRPEVVEQIPKHEVTLNGDDDRRSCEHYDSNDDSDDFLHTGKSTSENENSFAKGKIWSWLKGVFRHKNGNFPSKKVSVVLAKAPPKPEEYG